MKSKDVAIKLRADGFVPSMSDDLGACGQRAVNLVQALEKINLEIDLPVEATFEEVAEAINSQLPEIGEISSVWLPDFIGGIAELHRHHQATTLKVA